MMVHHVDDFGLCDTFFCRHYQNATISTIPSTSSKVTTAVNVQTYHLLEPGLIIDFL